MSPKIVEKFGEDRFCEMKTEVAEVLERRTAKYESAAQYRIDTDEITPVQVTAEVIKYWKTAEQ